MKKTALSFLLFLMSALLFACHRISDKIVVTIGMWPEASLKADVAMFEEWETAFETANPEYDIKASPYTYDKETFRSLAESKNLPTVYQTWFTEPRGIIAGGHAKDITEVVKKLGWFDKLDPKLAEYLTFENRLYGIPRDGYGLGLVINLDIFEEVGLIDEQGMPIYPKTMDELRNTARLVHEETGKNGLIVLNSNKNGGWQFSNFAWNFGATLQTLNEDGKWEAHLNSDGAVAALEMIKAMRWEDNSLKANGTITYNDWHVGIANGTAAMAIAGNDVLSAVTTSGLSKDRIAFVPMPEGPGGARYTLFGGTPYMFSEYSTDEQVIGAIKFLEYMGRSPEVGQIAYDSMKKGMQVATNKGMLILPSVKPWINKDFLEMSEGIEKDHINVDMRLFNDFYSGLSLTRRAEEPNYPQEMYEILDEVLRSIMNNQDMSPKTLLDAANFTFQTQYLDRLNG